MQTKNSLVYHRRLFKVYTRAKRAEEMKKRLEVYISTSFVDTLAMKTCLQILLSVCLEFFRCVFVSSIQRCRQATVKIFTIFFELMFVVYWRSCIENL